jgi:hypothetical protein
MAECNVICYIFSIIHSGVLKKIFLTRSSAVMDHWEITLNGSYLCPLFNETKFVIYIILCVTWSKCSLEMHVTKDGK